MHTLLTKMFRNPGKGKTKSLAQLKKEGELGAKCTLAGCNEPLTDEGGKNCNKLCKKHQYQQKEFDGLGDLSRPWTFHRTWTCCKCNYDPRTDARFDNVEFDSEEHKRRTMRNMLVADHIVRRADGGDDSASNIQTLCKLCDAFKTAFNNDHRPGISLDLPD